MATIAEENIIIDFQVRTDGLHVASKSVAALNTDAKKLEDTLAKGIGAGFDSKSIAQKLLSVDNAINRINEGVKKAAKGDLSALEREFADIAKAASLTSAEIEHLANNGEQVARELSKLGNIKTPDAGGGGFFGRIKEFALGGVIANGVTSLIGSFTQLAGSVFQAGAAFEKTQATFNNAFGDKKLAEDYISLIQDFAATTPFEFDRLAESVLKLTNRGFTPVREELTKLGDIAASSGKDFDQLAEAVLDAQTGEFERLKEFGIRASKANGEVSLSFKGQTVSVKDNEKAIRDAIIAFGDLEGVQGTMASQAKTTDGVLSNFKDTLTQISIRIFQAFGPTINTFIQKTGEFIQKLFDYVAPLGKAFSDLFGTLFEGVSAGDVLSKVFDIIGISVKSLVSYMNTTITTVTDLIKWFKELGDTVPIIGNSFDFIKSVIGNVIDGLSKLPAFLAAGQKALKQFYSNLKNLDFSVGIADTFKKEYDSIINDQKKLNDNSKKNAATEEAILKRRAEQEKKLNASKTGKGNGDARKEALQKELDAESLKFKIQENNARRTIKNEKELEKKLKEIEIQKQIALANIRKKYAKDGTLDFETEVGKILELAAELQKLEGKQVEFDINVNAPEPAAVFDLVKKIKDDIAAGLIITQEDIDAALKAASDAISKRANDFAADNAGQQRILEAVRTGDSKVIDKVEDEEGIKSAERGLQSLKDEFAAYVVDENRTSEGLFELKRKIIDAEIELERKKNSEKEKTAEDEKRRAQERLEEYRQIVSAAKELTDVVLTEAIRRKDAEIKIQEDRINGLLNTIDKGNTEQVQLEEERLKKLREEKEKYVQAQRRIAAIEISINTALAASQAITAITAAFKEGNIFKGIATSLALAAQVAATIITVRNAFSNVPSFRKGTERTGRGGIDGYGGFNAILHPDERVLTAEQNAPLLRYGIKNDDVPKLALLGLGMKKFGTKAANVDLSKMEKIMKEQNQKLDRITEVLQNSGMDVSISDEGILTMSNRAKDRMEKAKRMRR